MMKTLNALVAAAAVSCVMASSAANAETYTYPFTETHTVDFSLDDNFLYFNNTSYALPSLESYGGQPIRVHSETDSNGLSVSRSHYPEFEGGYARGNYVPPRGYREFFDIRYSDIDIAIQIWNQTAISHDSGVAEVVFFRNNSYRYIATTFDQANSWLNFGNGEISLTDFALRDDSYGYSELIFDTNGGQLQSAHLVFTITVVPEPETYAMLLAGLGIVGAVARRRNKRD
jgi:hypothetical protein